MKRVSPTTITTWTPRYETLRGKVQAGTPGDGLALVLGSGVVAWLEEGDRLPPLPSPLPALSAGPFSSRPAAAAILANVALGGGSHRRSSPAQTSFPL